MFKSVIVVLAAAAVVAVPNSAGAATKGKKLTYEQAWATCKSQIDKQFSWDWHNARYSAGSACMLKHGYRI